MTIQAQWGGSRGATLFVRALQLRCPICGDRRLFAGWLSMRPRCLQCRLRTERPDGFFLGAMTFNLVVSELTFVAGLVLAIVLTWPATPWTAIWIGSVLGIVIAPFVFFPFTRALWLAFDLYFQPPTDEDFADTPGFVRP